MVKRMLASVALLAIATAAGVAAASALISPGDQSAVSGPPEEKPAANTQSAEGLSADPRGGPAWAVEVGRSAQGRSCARPGRTVGGKVGALDRNGAVREFPPEGGNCLDVSALSDDQPVALFVDGEDRDPRTNERDPVTVVWGLAKPGIESVSITSPRGTRTLPVSARHAFIAIYRGPFVDDLRIEARRGDGTKVAFTRQGPSARIRERILNPPSPEQIQRELEEAERREQDPSYHGG